MTVETLVQLLLRASSNSNKGVCSEVRIQVFYDGAYHLLEINHVDELHGSIVITPWTQFKIK